MGASHEEVMRIRALDPSIRTGIISGAPLRVVIDLNEVCNLQCTYCHIDALFRPHALNGREIPIEVVKSLLDEIEKMQVLEVTFTGGEISIMANFAKYIRLLSGLSYTASQIITNGTTITERTIQTYIEGQITRISVSLDGFATVNDQMRGELSFGRALRAIEVAVAHGLPVNVITVLTQKNYHKWKAFSAFLKDSGVASHNLTLLCRLGRAEQITQWLGLAEEQVQWLAEDFAQFEQSLRSVDYHVTLNAGALHPGIWDGTAVPIHQLQDILPGTEAVIKVNGDVFTNRIAGRNSCIGNVFASSLYEIWDNSKMYRLEMAERIIGQPDENAENYYHLRSKKALHEARRQEYAAPSHGIERSRQLMAGRILVFRWPDFTASLRSGDNGSIEGARWEPCSVRK